MASIGPVVLSTEGDQYLDPARIQAVVWEGVSTSGDTARLVCRGTGQVLWRGRTDGTQTYQGANFSPKGVHAPFGFRASQLSSGALLVYLLEG